MYIWIQIPLLSTAAGVDYRPPMPNSFVFTTTQTRLCTDIEIVDDQDVEGDVDETFNILLSQTAVPADPSVQISPAVATVFIDDNDSRLLFGKQVYGITTTIFINSQQQFLAVNLKCVEILN